MNIFLPTVDTVLSQLILRYDRTYDIAEQFGFLTPTNLLELNDDDLIKSSYDFVLKYENDISSDFSRQLITLESVISNCKTMSTKNLVQFIINNGLPSSFPDILSACIIFMLHSLSVPFLNLN